MNVETIIGKHFDALVSLCRKYKVERLYAFGSVVSSKFNLGTSDLDLIVELEPMPPIEKGESLLSLWNELENLYGRNVDLLTDKPIRNPYLRNAVEETRHLIYDREGQEVSI